MRVVQAGHQSIDAAGDIRISVGEKMPQRRIRHVDQWNPIMIDGWRDRMGFHLCIDLQMY